tara:strand:+ start:574 stop:831 length:258 start_codon:yes stop_codon:yes gene_type:complete
MEPTVFGKELLDESRISEINPEFTQTLSDRFHYDISNSLYAMLKDNNPDFENTKDHNGACDEVIMATRNFMKEYIKIYEKYTYDN